MATEDPFAQEDPEKKKLLGTQDPLFYEGLTPVLGEAVSVQEPAGELAFPEASPVAAPAPGAPGSPYPAFPEFGLEAPIPPTFNFPGGEPPVAPEMQLPQQDVPWWQEGLDLVSKGKSIYDKVSQLGTQPAEGAYPLVSPAELGQYTPEGMGIGYDPAWGEVAAEGAGGPAVSSPEALYPSGSEPSALAGLNWADAAIPGVQTAMSAYSMYNAIKDDNPTAMALSAPGLVGGAASTAAALAPAALGALAPLGPAAAVMMLPYIFGQIVEKYGPNSADKARWPKGFQYVPGSGSSRGIGGRAVDPATGRMLVYKGNGKYAWAEETQQGMPASPEQFKQWQIEPTGKLLEDPRYAKIPIELRDEDIARAGQPLSEGGAPGYPTVAHQRSYLETWRQPYIDRIKAQNPMASEGELWRLYTQTAEYQQELNMIAAWGPTGQAGGEPSEGGTGESSAPGGSGTPDGGGAENY